MYLSKFLSLSYIENLSFIYCILSKSLVYLISSPRHLKSVNSVSIKLRASYLKSASSCGSSVLMRFDLCASIASYLSITSFISASSIAKSIEPLAKSLSTSGRLDRLSMY